MFDPTHAIGGFPATRENNCFAHMLFVQCLRARLMPKSAVSRLRNRTPPCATSCSVEIGVAVRRKRSTQAVTEALQFGKQMGRKRHRHQDYKLCQKLKIVRKPSDAKIEAASDNSETHEKDPAMLMEEQQHKQNAECVCKTSMWRCLARKGTFSMVFQGIRRSNDVKCAALLYGCMLGTNL